MHCTVQGIVTSYTDTGDGRVVVLLHGWGSNKETFAALQRVLQKSFRVICVDLPGFGETAQPSLDWRVDDYVQFVADVLATARVKQVYAYVGHSFGGRLCLKGLSQGVFDAEKLVLIGSAGVARSTNFRNQTIAIVAKAGKQVMKLPYLRTRYDEVRQKLHAKTGSTDYANAGNMQQIFRNVVHEDLSGAAAQITIPTLLIWGSEDTQTPLSDARFFHTAIKGSQLKIIQQAGHFVHNDYPEKVASWIREFLS